MSPEDDLQTQRIPAIDEMPLNRGWNPISQNENVSPPTTAKTNGHNGHQSSANSPNVHPYTNGKNGVKSMDKSWSTAPLLIENKEHTDSESEQTTHTSNNNDWSSNKQQSREIKNGWKEVPQDEDMNGAAAHKLNGNGLTNGTKNGVQNGNITVTIPTINGHSDKLALAEQDPLTGGEHHTRKDPDLDELSECGVGTCHPGWSRIFASTHAFMFVFLLGWVLQVIDIIFFLYIFVYYDVT